MRNNGSLILYCTECSKVYHYSFYEFEKRAYVQTDTQPGNRETGLWYHHIIVNRAESHPMSSYTGMQRQMWLMKVGNHSNASPECLSLKIIIFYFHRTFCGWSKDGIFEDRGSGGLSPLPPRTLCAWSVMMGAMHSWLKKGYSFAYE